MAKIQRKQQKIFAGLANTDEKAVFGSMKTGEPVYSDDIEQLQSADYEQGWQNAIVLEKAPFLEEMNGVQYGLSSQIAYLLQQGMPEWDPETTYYTNSFCSYNGVIYRSLVDENIGNIPSSTQLSWEEFTSGSEGDSLNDKITNCILSNSGASITKQDYTQASYVNKDCTVSETNVVSGFAATAYIILNKTFTNSSAFTFTIPFTLNSNTGVQPLVAINDTANSIAVVNGVLRFNYMGETLSGSTSLAASTAYTLQFVRTDSGYTAQIKSAADDEYTQEINLPSSLDYFSGKTVYLGSDRVNALNGTIDLANTSIQADSATYWDINTLLNFQTVTLSGALDTLMPDGRKEDLTLNNLEQTVALDTTLLLNNSTGNTKTILVKDNNEVMIRDNYTESDNEPAGAVSGDVWFDTASNQMKEQQVVLPNLINSGCSFYDGVASGFSQTNYLSLPSSYDLGGNWSISLPVNIQTNEDNDKNVILGDLTEDDGAILPESVAVVYDGDETVTAYLRRADVYGATKRTVTSTAYTVTKGDSTGYVSVEGTAESYVPASTQVYADSMMTVELEVAAANTWTYTGDSTENITTQSGYVKPSGSVFVPSGTQVYSNADLTTPLEVASGSDWIYTGTTSPSLIGALNETVTPQNDNVTIIGALNNTNGVLSGFSNSNYATLSTAFNPGSEPWEMVWKITTGTNLVNQTIVGRIEGQSLSIDIGNAKFRISVSSNGTSWDVSDNQQGSYTVLTNTTYWLKAAFTGSAYTLAYSLTGEPESYVTDVTISSSTPIFAASAPNIYLGRDYSGNNIMSGSIDLNESYININDETWWQYQSGDNTLELSYNGSQYSLGSQTLASTDIVRNGWLPTIGSAPSTPDAYFNSTIDIANADFSFWSWNGISDIKPNFEMFGDVTFNDGVLSGFSETNYALTPNTPPQNITSYEFVTKFTTGALNDIQQGILANSNTNRATPQIIINFDNRLTFAHPISSSTWTENIYQSINANTTYWAKATWDGETVSFYYKTTEEGDYSLIGTQSATTIYWTEVVGIGIDTTELPFNGSIDLNETYININGVAWWRWNGITEAGYSWQEFPAAKIGEIEMKTEVVEPNITINGTLANNNGVFGGFSADNYITTQPFQPGSNPWEIYTKVNIDNNALDGNNIIIGSGPIAARIAVWTNATHWVLSLSSTNTSWNIGDAISGTYTILPNTNYWLKISFTGSAYTLAYSLTGEPESYVTDVTISSSTPIYNTNVPLVVGSNKGSLELLSPWDGSIDLNSTYFSINNEIVWRWNGYTEQTNIYSYASGTLDYPVELVKKDDYISLKDLLYPIGRPVPCLNGEGLNNGEIWLEGSLENISTYPALYQVYGTTYGGDGVNTFGLPNFRGRVPWGTEDGTFGYISAGLPNITGSVYFQNMSTGGNGHQIQGGATGVLYPSGGSAACAGGNNWYNVNNTINFNAQRGNALFGASSTVQPPSIKVRWKTRYK